MSVIKSTIATPAPELERAWLATGWRPGAPSHLPASVILADRESYEDQVCPCCGADCQTVRHWHRGQRLRLQLTCAACGHSDEA
jgi:hypothetical protein